MKDRRCSIWHLISGIIMLILGIVVWANPLSSLYAIAIYFGGAVFLLGCGYITFSFSEYSGWYFVVGLLDLFIGDTNPLREYPSELPLLLPHDVKHKALTKTTTKDKINFFISKKN